MQCDIPTHICNKNILEDAWHSFVLGAWNQSPFKAAWEHDSLRQSPCRDQSCDQFSAVTAHDQCSGPHPSHAAAFSYLKQSLCPFFPALMIMCIFELNRCSFSHVWGHVAFVFTCLAYSIALNTCPSRSFVLVPITGFYHMFFTCSASVGLSVGTTSWHLWCIVNTGGETCL